MTSEGAYDSFHKAFLFLGEPSSPATHASGLTTGNPMIFRNITLCFLFFLCVLTACSWLPGGEPPNSLPSPRANLASNMGQDKAYALFLQGSLEYEEGNFDEAAELLTQALELDPEAAYIHYFMALIQTQKGELDQAVAEAKSALEGDPGLIDAHKLLGEIFLAAKKPDKAIVHLKKVLEAEPEEEEGYLKLGVAYVQTGELSQATKAFKDLLAKNPNSLAAMLALGRLYRQAGLFTLAENHYREILQRQANFFPAFLELGEVYEKLDQPKDALELYRQGLELSPEKVSIRFRIARLLINENRLDEALAEYQAVLVDNPGNAEALQKSGLIYLEKLDWKAAEEAFKQVLEGRPDLDQVRYYLGISLEKQDKSEEALKVFSAIKPGGREYSEVLAHIGYLFHSLHRGPEGIEFLKSHLNDETASPGIFRLLSILYKVAGKEREAFQALETGLEKFPADLDLLYQKGIALEENDRRDEAMAVMNEVLEIDPEHSDAINYIAYTLAERGIQLDKALEMAKKALALNNSSHIQDTVGWVYFKMGNYPKALHYLKMAAETMSSDPIVLQHLGDIYAAMGKKQEAREVYEKILEISPDEKGVREKLKQLPQ